MLGRGSYGSQFAFAEASAENKPIECVNHPTLQTGTTHQIWMAPGFVELVAKKKVWLRGPAMYRICSWLHSELNLHAQKPLHGLVLLSQILLDFFEKAEDAVNERVYITPRP